MTDKFIDEKLNEIFKDRISINFKENEGLKDEFIFGRKVNMPVREAVLILIDIENEFEISMPKEKIKEGEFSTYRKIFELIKHECNLVWAG